MKSKRPAALAAAAVLACFSLTSFAQSEFEYKDGQWVKSALPVKGTPAGELATMRRMAAMRSNSAVVSAADDFLKNYPDSPLREEVMMLAGQAEMNRDRYYQAYGWFKRQWEEYPTGAYAERALQREYEIAEAFLAGKKRVVAYIIYLPARTDGQDILNHIAEQAPGSLLAELALLRVAEDHFSHREFPESAQAYDHYMELFTKSGKYRDAMLQAALATHLSYRGPQFDPTSLIEAQQRYKNFKEQYPQTAIKADVAGTLKRIESQRAQQEYETASFYDRTGQKQAAAFYYRLVMNDYPNTDYAGLAQISLKNLGPVAPPRPPPAAMQAPKTAMTWPTTSPIGIPTKTGPATASGPSATGPARKTKHPEPMDIEKILPVGED
jgi:outer membrane protein assembly factor BamD (BamD/ComL family)